MRFALASGSIASLLLTSAIASCVGDDPGTQTTTGPDGSTTGTDGGSTGNDSGSSGNDGSTSNDAGSDAATTFCSGKSLALCEDFEGAAFPPTAWLLPD